jgi:hypothetical protein
MLVNKDYFLFLANCVTLFSEPVLLVTFFKDDIFAFLSLVFIILILINIVYIYIYKQYFL